MYNNFNELKYIFSNQPKSTFGYLQNFSNI